MLRVLGDDKLKKEGYLKKKGEVFKTWKRRYFTLVGSDLTYYTEQYGDIIGLIKLTPQCTVTMSFAKSNCIELRTPDRTWFFVGESEEDISEWQGAIQKALLAD